MRPTLVRLVISGSKRAAPAQKPKYLKPLPPAVYVSDDLDDLYNYIQPMHTTNRGKFVIANDPNLKIEDFEAAVCGEYKNWSGRTARVGDNKEMMNIVRDFINQS